MKKLGEGEWKARFETYLKEHGPNPATSFFGSGGWYACMASNLRDVLHDEGFEIDGYEENKAIKAKYEEEYAREVAYVTQFGQAAWKEFRRAELDETLARGEAKNAL
jgi:hypothetical protein